MKTEEQYNRLKAKYEQALAELAHASLFMPAQRTERTTEPVNAVGPLNEAYWFGLEAAEKDFDVFGKPYQEVTA